MAVVKEVTGVLGREGLDRKAEAVNRVEILQASEVIRVEVKFEI